MNILAMMDVGMQKRTMSIGINCGDGRSSSAMAASEQSEGEVGGQHNMTTCKVAPPAFYDFRCTPTATAAMGSIDRTQMQEVDDNMIYLKHRRILIG